MLSFTTDQVTSFLALWAALTLVFGLVYKWWRKPHSNFPHGPRGIPILGVLPYLGEKPEETLRRWSEEKYGPVMSIRMGMEDVVVLSSFEAIMQAFVRQGSQFAGRPTTGVFPMLETNEGGVSFKSYTNDYKHQKKFAAKALRDFGKGKQAADEIVNEEADFFNEFLTSKHGQLVDIKIYIYAITSNVVSRVICGQRYDYEDSEMKNLIHALKSIFADPQLGIVDMFPVTRWLPTFRSAVENFIKHEYHVYYFVMKHWERHKLMFEPNDIKDLMDLFRHEQKFGTSDGQASFTDHQMRWLGTDLFVAGAETTSTQLGWCFHLYVYFSEYQKTLEDEIFSAFGTNGKVTQNQKSKTPFLNAFIQECLRFRTVGPLVLKHSTLCSTKLMGFDITSGTSVIPNFHAVHMDPKLWNEPEKFDPYRHLDEEGNFIFSSKIIPFSIGHRSCPGENLARTEVYIFFAKILLKFKILPGDKPPHVDCISSVVTFAKPYEFRIQQR